MKRFLGLGVILLLLVSSISLPAAQAQGGVPTDIVDAAFRDLSQKLSRTITRDNFEGTWNWEEFVYQDSALGCPKPGQTYTQVVTRGFKIIISIQGSTYDYRASADRKNLFLCTVGPAGASTSTTATPVADVVNVTSPVAFVGRDGEVYIGDIAQNSQRATALTNDAGARISPVMPFRNENRSYGQFQWSPDGSGLLYTDRRAGGLYVVQTGQKPRLLVPVITRPFPGAWSPNGKEIAYPVTTAQSVPGTTKLIVQLQAVPSSGGQARVVESFAFGVGCGGGAIADPADLMYIAETAYGGNVPTLFWTELGFVHMTRCDGIGLALTSPGGQVAWENPTLKNAALSPDRKRIAAVQVDGQGRSVGLAVVDLATGNATALTVQAGVDQLAWMADGTDILYSTVVRSRTVRGNPESKAGLQIMPLWPVDGIAYSVVLWRVPVAGGQSVQLFNQEGRGIGIIAPARDASAALVSFITSSASFVERINTATDAANLASNAPMVSLQIVPLNPPGPRREYAFGSGSPAFSPGGSFQVAPAVRTAITSGGPSVARGVPNLVVGGQAVVTVKTGDGLNLREGPSRSNRLIKVLKTGTIVMILAGPQFVEGFRWWQIRDEEDGTIGWAVDQVAETTGVETTLSPR